MLTMRCKKNLTDFVISVRRSLFYFCLACYCKKYIYLSCYFFGNKNDKKLIGYRHHELDCIVLNTYISLGLFTLEFANSCERFCWFAHAQNSSSVHVVWTCWHERSGDAVSGYQYCSNLYGWLSTAYIRGTACVVLWAPGLHSAGSR